jgi:hypothetical protein
MTDDRMSKQILQEKPTGTWEREKDLGKMECVVRRNKVECLYHEVKITFLAAASACFASQHSTDSGWSEMMVQYN